jgi:mycothiol system anti-sigma-R factor
MSCGGPHETDCREVLEEVYLYLDGEMDATRRTLVRQHLDECSPCLRQFGVEHEVKMLVARRCGGDRAPDSVRVAVLERLRTIQVQWESAEFQAD